MKKWLIISLSVVLIFLFVGSSYGYYNYYQKFKEQQDNNIELNSQIESLKSDLEKYQKSSESSNETKKSTTSLEDSENLIDTSGWSTYTNSKYGYSFKYPSVYTTAGCQSKPCKEFIGEEEGGDRIMVQGDISQSGWPNIEITHSSTDYYNPSADVDLHQWILDNNPTYTEYLPTMPSNLISKKEGGKYSAFDVIIPASSQAYSQRYVIFLNSVNQLFVITMNDYEDYSEDFYSAWLNTFKY